jgi:hypothetical protein
MPRTSSLLINDKLSFVLVLHYTDMADDYRCIDFEITLPFLYDSYDIAVDNQNYSATMVKGEDGSVCILVTSDKTNDVVDTIKWDEYWKYRCTIQKLGSIGKFVLDSYRDHEPCSLRFEDIFLQYTRYRAECICFSMQGISYRVIPAYHIEKPDAAELDEAVINELFALVRKSGVKTFFPLPENYRR